MCCFGFQGGNVAVWALMKATTQKYSNETELLKHILKYLIFETKQNKTFHHKLVNTKCFVSHTGGSKIRCNLCL